MEKTIDYFRCLRFAKRISKSTLYVTGITAFSTTSSTTELKYVVNIVSKLHDVLMITSSVTKELVLYK